MIVENRFTLTVQHTRRDNVGLNIFPFEVQNQIFCFSDSSIFSRWLPQSKISLSKSIVNELSLSALNYLLFHRLAGNSLDRFLSISLVVVLRSQVCIFIINFLFILVFTIFLLCSSLVFESLSFFPNKLDFILNTNFSGSKCSLLFS